MNFFVIERWFEEICEKIEFVNGMRMLYVEIVEGFFCVVNFNMVNVICLILVVKGYDFCDYMFCVFGGVVV